MHIETENHVEPRKIGHKWFDIGITLCVLFVSVSSLIVALVHSQTLEKMADANSRLVEANSWPYLDYGTGNSVGTNRNAIEMRLANDGVGPAKVETAELRWNGRPQRNAAEFLKACCGYQPDPANGLWTDILAGRVLRAGETITFLTLPRTPRDETAWTRLNAARLNPHLAVNICYCSVFDECWTENVLTLSLTPRRVDHCAKPAVPYGAPH